LTGAVTSIEAILFAIKEVFKQFSEKKAGITLANTFPTMAFRETKAKSWDEGIIVGMGGSGALNISYLSLAKAAPLGLNISGNGGAMNYKEAANFLAMGCTTVQFCSMPTKMGYGIVNELHSGLSHMMAQRGIKSIDELIGIALPDPITDFMDLSPLKKISESNHDLCVQCGNCLRCPYLAIDYNDFGYPETDPSRCIGCKMCNYMCFTGAMRMRDRTAEEKKALNEQ
jgi:dihydropyrimidine dehydrogenase (NAD+) subunit PreA